jgi:hypothetical protein
MEKLFKLTASPSAPAMEVVGDLIVKLHVPYSDKAVTLQINPNVADYQDKQGSNLRQMMVSTGTPDTKNVTLDFETKNVQQYEVGGKNYEFKLMRIGNIQEEKQNFRFFEILARQVQTRIV